MKMSCLEVIFKIFKKSSRSTSWPSTRWMQWDMLLHSRPSLLKKSTLSLRHLIILINGLKYKLFGPISYLSSLVVISPNKCLLSPKSSKVSINNGSRSWREPMSKRTLSNAALMTSWELLYLIFKADLSSVKRSLRTISRPREISSLDSISAPMMIYFKYYLLDLILIKFNHSLKCSSMLSIELLSMNLIENWSLRSFKSWVLIKKRSN
jgi:hypothetical protein